MGAAASYDVPLDATSPRRLLVQRKVSKLLSDPAALEALCGSLFERCGGGVSREQLRQLTREVVSSAAMEDEKALSELLEMLEPAPNNFQDGQALSWDAFLCYARCVLRLLHAALQAMAIDLMSTTFMMVCMALVQLMTPGLAFFYAGLVKDTSVLSMMMKSFVSMGVAGMIWFFFGFSLCFGDSLTVIGNPGTFAGLRNLNMHEALPGQTIPGLLFAGFQGMYAVVTPALMTGAFADRFHFKPYLIFIALWLVVVYAPCCHWVWGGGWLAQWGVWDFAGGIVVQITAGFSALASLIVVGKRQIAEDDKDGNKPHKVPFLPLGTALLWLAWFGFTAGSALAGAAGGAGGAAVAAVNTEIAAAVALFLWLIVDWVHHGRPGLGLCIGSIAGLAAVTPCAGFIQPWGAFVLGVAALICYACCELKKKFGFDNALDVWAALGMGGFIGSVLLGVLADPEECGDAPSAPSSCVNPGTVTASWEQLGKQLAAALLCATYSFLTTLLLLKALNLVMFLTPDHDNLDVEEHGETAYDTPAKQHIQSHSSDHMKV
ncbi:unnamed protein product [Effrenium voratum]|uniref:Ammonium transporter n=1 Tax=Effrenium voratum TaxID=2562239 RepID=A0AA36HKK7_9DINO|nr:unnamed protein product [Effrenium voratum]